MMRSKTFCQRIIENIGVNNCHNNLKTSKDTKAQFHNINDTLASGHNVTVSSTMIKITYNKGTKDQSGQSVIKNEYENNEDSIVYEPSQSNCYNTHKHSTVNDNHYKSSEIIFISNNMEATINNGSSLKKKRAPIDEKYREIVNQEKHQILVNDKSFSKTCGNVKNNNVNNQFLHNLNQFKELKVKLPKLRLLTSQSSANSAKSFFQLNEESQNLCCTGVNEGGNKKSIKSEDVKISNESKNFSFKDNAGNFQTKHNSTSSEVSNLLVKEELKIPKNKNEYFKKKRSISVDNFSQNKKIKIDPFMANKLTKDKVNESKINDKEKKINLNSIKNKNIIKPDHVTVELHKKELLVDDPTLPAGWQRIIKGKHCGTEFKPVVCIASPEGRKFYFKAKLKDYLERTNSPFTIEDFHFGLYKKKLPKERRSTEKKMEKKKNSNKIAKEKKCQASSQGKRTKQITSHNVNALKQRSGQIVPLSASKNISSVNTSEENISSNSVGRNSKMDELCNFKKKNFLLIDPDLPTGWSRKLRIKKDGKNHDKFQVWIVSPDGKKFRRKYLLQKYLIRNRSTLNIDQFYFGLYPKKGSNLTLSDESDKNKKQQILKHLVKPIKKYIKLDKANAKKSDIIKQNKKPFQDLLGKRQMNLVLNKVDNGENIYGGQPMFDDPNLPPGWRRHIKVRSTGESAGRMEVIIISPDGKRHRSKGNLEHYIKQKGLNHKIDDFDFSIFGKNSRSPNSTFMNATASKYNAKKRESTLPSNEAASDPKDPDSPLKLNISREALLINYVSGLMINCGLRDVRSERRQKIPRDEHEKLLKKHLDSETKAVNDENDISTSWIQKLIHCRSDFGTLDVDAAATIASLTKEFLRKLTRKALEISKTETSLEYSDVAELVDQSECLSPLKTLIPKKITFRKFLKLNMPKNYLSVQ